MDEKFNLFLNQIPFECQDFVLELDEYLTKKRQQKNGKNR